MAKKSGCDERPWLAQYEERVPESLQYEERCLPWFLDRSAETFSPKVALIFQGLQITYGELKEMVDRFAACLHDLGVRKGESVAILLPNIVPCVVSYYAVLKIGGVAVMNNPLYSDRELEYQFNDSGAKVLITLDLLGNRMIDLKRHTSIRQIIYTSIGDYLPVSKRIFFNFIAKRKGLAKNVKPANYVYRWKDVLKRYPPDPPAIELSFDDIAMYQYTGGTTGVPKGVILTHGNLSKQVQQIAAWLPRFDKGREIILGALPFFHMFGLSTVMNLAIYMGWGNILVPKPQPGPLLDAIRQFKPTFAPLVPTMFIGMLNHPKIDNADLTSIKGAFSGSAPLAAEIIRNFEKKTGAVIVEGYGLTESAPVTHVNPFITGKRKIGSIGIPLPDTLCRIVDLNDGKTDLPTGKIGELLIKGPQVMKGYLNKPEETAEALADGWLRTGDIARMDEDGFFYIVDRKKDMIISGGYKVYPREIDEIFYGHPKILEACSVGIPHEYRGEVVKVFVVLKKGETATEEELMEYCRTRLARYKLPAEIEFRKELPKSSVGKVLRNKLRPH